LVWGGGGGGGGGGVKFATESSGNLNCDTSLSFCL